MKEAWNSIKKPFGTEKATKQGLAVFNATSWSRDAEIVEVDIDSLIPNAERLLNGKFHQISSDGKKALVIVNHVPAYSIKAFAFGNMPNHFTPITGTYCF
jgi:hypothetical protein